MIGPTTRVCLRLFGAAHVHYVCFAIHLRDCLVPAAILVWCGYSNIHGHKYDIHQNTNVFHRFFLVNSRTILMKFCKDNFRVTR